MKNRVNWFYLIYSFLFIIVSAALLTYFENKENNIYNFITNSLSFASLPALFISCMVIISVKDVQEEIKKINEYISVLADFESNARIYFYNNYSGHNGFLGQLKQLNKDIDIVIKQEMGENSNEVLRMVTTSRECVKYIKSFSYIDAHIKTFELKKISLKNIQSEEEVKQKAYLSFSSENKEKLLELLNRLYSEKKILESTDLDILSDLLCEYDKICETLHSNIRREISAYNGKNTEFTNEEERIDE